MMGMSVIKGDITKLEIEAIVNAANTSLMGGGGVDGAIHRAAGPRLLEACLGIGGCPTGQAVVTPAYDLPCRYVIHTVGPIYDPTDDEVPKTLASCYESSLRLAFQYDLATVAFPCISTGAYGYPNEEAAAVAVGAVRDWMSREFMPRAVIFCCFSDDDRDIYEALMD